jgi:RNA polymerase sigma-70 factor (ECF subfamily)
VLGYLQQMIVSRAADPDTRRDGKHLRTATAKQEEEAKVRVRTKRESQTATAPLPVPINLAGDDERELIAQAKDGCAVATEQLIGHYKPRVFRVAQKITRNHEDSEEVVQNAFMKAFQNLAGFRGDSRFYSWLVRITINEALMNVRRRRGREVSIDESSQNEAMTPLQLEDCGPNPEECYCREELQRILETSIGGLGPEYRSVFQLRDVQGFTTEETARALDLSLSAVKTRLRRARLRLRDSLDTYGVKKRSGNQAYVAERYSEAAL